MCLGIPGRVVTIGVEHPHLAEVEVAGVTRTINIGILEERPHAGDWILIQTGFAIEKIDEQTARTQLALLNRYTGGPTMAEGFEDNWPDDLSVSDGPDHDKE